MLYANECPREGSNPNICVHVCMCLSVLTETSQGRVDAVRPVCGCHDNHMSSLLQAVHQGQELGDDTPLHFTMGLHTCTEL